MTGAAFAVRLLPALVVLLGWSVGACAAAPSQPASAVPAGISSAESASATPSSPAPAGQLEPPAMTSTPPPAVRQGATASSTRVRFLPQLIELPSGDSAVVEPVPSVDGVLQVPADVSQVGWWDGGAEAGDPFGSTVIAGHVDSATQGLGIFAQLLLIQVGDQVTLRSGSATLSYQVVSSTLVTKEALAQDGAAFDQRGPHRLVLITCSGRWHPETRSYDSNMVVVAEPSSPE